MDILSLVEQSETISHILSLLSITEAHSTKIDFNAINVILPVQLELTVLTSFTNRVICGLIFVTYALCRLHDLEC